MHRVSHVVHTVAPAIDVARHGGHAGLGHVAGRTVCEDQLFPFCVRQQLHRLIEGEVVPADHALLQREIVGGVLAGGKTYSRFWVGAETHRANCQAVVAGREVRDAVLPMAVGKHNRGDSGFRVLGFDESALERRAVGAFYRPGNRCGGTNGAEENNQA